MLFYDAFKILFFFLTFLKHCDPITITKKKNLSDIYKNAVLEMYIIFIGTKKKDIYTIYIIPYSIIICLLTVFF